MRTNCELYIGVLVMLLHSTNGEPLVETPLGKIRGSTMTSTGGRNFMAFRGIPYAEPPVGSRRFKDPEPVKKWADVLDGTREGPFCLQFNPLLGRIRGAEDCLALNVYTHSLDSEKGLRPVMLWIHGGAWNIGSGNGETDFSGPNHFMDKDVVFVTVNYRLGPFGFYTTGTEEAPGNYGLLDQTLALEWVRDNIEHFGGDPKSVTIFGESAGGASVHFHVLSPRSKGLFHRAIAMSGSSLCPWATPDGVEKYSQNLAKRVGCLKSTSSEMLECLRNISSKDLMEIPKDGFVVESVFGPRIDVERQSPFLPSGPRDLMEGGQINHVPLMTGVTQNEGLLFLAISGLLYDDDEITKKINQNPIPSIVSILRIKDKSNAPIIAQRASAQYLDSDLHLKQQVPALEKMASDYQFFKCIDDTVNYHSRHSDQPIYYYRYAHRGQFTFLSFLGVPTEVDYGVCHADEVFLMFTNNVLPRTKSLSDAAVSKNLVDLWSSFAVQGTPKSAAVPRWLPTSENNTRYLDINSEPSLINEKMPFYDRLSFWDQALN